MIFVFVKLGYMVVMLMFFFVSFVCMYLLSISIVVLVVV